MAHFRSWSYRRIRLYLLCLLLPAGFSCGGPIPDGFGIQCAPRFLGSPAVPHPLLPKDVAPHPLLSPVSGIHSDAANSDTDDFAGPLGIDPRVDSSFIGICPIIMFDGQGHIDAVSLDIDIIGMGITRIDPATLEVVDRYAIPFDFEKLFQGGHGDQGVSVNGAYFHIDAAGRAIVGTQANIFLELEMRPDGSGGERWEEIRSVDLAPYIAEDDILIDTQYDWQGNIWFVSSEGAVGYMDHRSQTIHSILMPGEYIENGLAVAADGVFVLSSEACYRFEIDPVTRLPVHTWRIPYARGEVPKPGTFALGSGSTPTLLGEDLITFTDNAEGQVNLLVYRRNKRYPKDRLVCSVPLFEPGASAVDVSMIGYRNSIVVENMYNAGGFLDDYRRLAPGFTRVDVREDRCGCDVVWASDIRSTTVPKLSTGTGLIYTYTQALELEDPLDAWYFTAVDFETGQVVYRVLAGTGPYKANAFGAIAIGPDRTVYQGVAGGILALRDGS